MAVHVHPEKSHPVSSDPDISFVVARHAVHAPVDGDTCQSDTVTDGSIPDISTLIIHHQGSLTIEPDIVRLVGEDLQ